MSMIAFYTGTSGMVAFQNKMDVVSHNIANVNTNGYKARRATFQDLLYSRINTNVEGNHLVGHGVQQKYIDDLMHQAGLDQTNYSLDFAIVGNGYFQVDNRGEIEYTRNGTFGISMEGEEGFLVTSDGAYVLDRGGNRIQLDKNEDGSFVVNNLVEQLGVYTFPNQYGLIPQNGARYTESANSGAPQLAIPGEQAAGGEIGLEVLQGYLEFSGVDLGHEMVEVIMAQRAFQMNSRVVQTADQMAEVVNNLR